MAPRNNLPTRERNEDRKEEEGLRPTPTRRRVRRLGSIDREVYEAGITEDEISPHPGIGGILADPEDETDRRGG